MAVDSVAASANTRASLKPKSDKFNELKVEDFLKLMIAELQNQDPLNPTDNAKLLEQVNQIRSVQSSTQLTETLNAVLLGQNLSSASGLIGKEVRGLTAAGKEISGVVESVAVQDGSPVIHIGTDQLELKNIREILNG